MLDLSKHQQLLVDSQMMNQSIRRCLGWTEELIKEGKKALEYQVRVSDVELGGRVLVHEEVSPENSKEEDEVFGGGRLLSPIVEIEPVLFSTKDTGPLNDVTKASDASITRLLAEIDGESAEASMRMSTRDSSPFLSTPMDEDSPGATPWLGETL